MVADAGPPASDMYVAPQNDSRPSALDAGPPQGDMASTNKPKQSEEDYALVGGGPNGCNINGSGGGLFILLMGVFFMIRKRILPFIAIFMLMGITAFAAPPIRSFNPATSVDDYFVTKRAETLRHLNFNAQAIFNYGHRPLQVINRATGERVDTVLRFRQNLDLVFSIGLFDRFELGFDIPVVLGQGAGNLNWINYTGNLDDFERAEYGDFHLEPKVRLFTIGNDFKIDVSFALPITVPTGERNLLVGENGATITPTVLATIGNRYFSLGVNYGIRVRHNQRYQFMNQTIILGNESVLSIGASVRLVDGKGMIKSLTLIGDAWGFDGIDELMAGFRLNLFQNFTMTVGVGAGVTNDYGVSKYRAMWGFGMHFGGPPPCPTCNQEVKIVERVVEKVVEKVVVVNRIVVFPMVYFDTNKSNLKKDAIVALKDVVRILKENPTITRVRLEGHCDKRASSRYNQNLAQRRVEKVVDYLSAQGISLLRLVSKPLGETLANQSAKTEKDLQTDRRVEFKVLKVE
jgi:outer membrane protein OmpA-like peptidoglycan-associated protein